MLTERLCWVLRGLGWLILVSNSRAYLGNIRLGILIHQDARICFPVWTFTPASSGQAHFSGPSTLAFVVWETGLLRFPLHYIYLHQGLEFSMDLGLEAMTLHLRSHSPSRLSCSCEEPPYRSSGAPLLSPTYRCDMVGSHRNKKELTANERTTLRTSQQPTRQSWRNLGGMTGERQQLEWGDLALSPPTLRTFSFTHPCNPFPTPRKHVPCPF